VAWVKIDDAFHRMRKVRRAWRSAHPETVGLLVMSLAYANDELTDGHIDPEWVELQLLDTVDVDQPPALVVAMLDLDLWVPHIGAWGIHLDFWQHQPSAADVERVKEARRMAGALGGKRSGEARRNQSQSKA